MLTSPPTPCVTRSFSERPSQSSIVIADRTLTFMSTSDLRVLLVEDSQILAERLLELIDQIAGVSVIGIVDTESTAVETARQQRPDVLLLDLQLKQGTGFKVMRQLIDSVDVRPAFVVITNYALPSYRDQAYNLGACHFIDKTTNFDLIPNVLSLLRDERIPRIEPARPSA